MGKTATLSVSLATLGLVGPAWMNATLASPPAGHRRSALPAPAPLDLRLLASGLTRSENASAGFPSSLHRHKLGNQEEMDLPVMGAGSSQTRMPSRAEEFARRVRREGLPVARLWENQSALVSLGLNKKGKPGLWIIQKIR